MTKAKDPDHPLRLWFIPLAIAGDCIRVVGTPEILRVVRATTRGLYLTSPETEKLFVRYGQYRQRIYFAIWEIV